MLQSQFLNLGAVFKFHTLQSKENVTGQIVITETFFTFSFGDFDKFGGFFNFGNFGNNAFFAARFLCLFLGGRGAAVLMLIAVVSFLRSGMFFLLLIVIFFNGSFFLSAENFL